MSGQLDDLSPRKITCCSTTTVNVDGDSWPGKTSVLRCIFLISMSSHSHQDIQRSPCRTSWSVVPTWQVLHDFLSEVLVTIVVALFLQGDEFHHPTTFVGDKDSDPALMEQLDAEKLKE